MMKRQKAQWGSLVWAGCLAVWLTAGVRAEDTHYWIGGSGGFTTPGHWDTGVVPTTTNDYARFTTNTTITVQFAQSITNNRARVETSAGGRGDITWDLGGNEYHLVSEHVRHPPADGLALLVGQSGGVDLLVTNGHLYTYGFHVTGGASLQLAGTNTSWYNEARADWAQKVGATTTESLLRISQGARADLTSVTPSGGSGSRGTVEVTGNGSVLETRRYIYVGDYGHGRLIVRDGGRVEATEDIVLNRQALAGSHVGSGTLEVDGGRVFARHLSHGANDTNAHLRVTLHAGGTNALVSLTGDLVIRPGFKFHVTLDDDFYADIGEEFTIVQVGGEVTGAAGLFENPLDGYAPLTEGAILVYDQGAFAMMPYEFQVSYAGGTSGNDFTLTVIPEPLSATLLGIAGALLWVRRRRWVC